MDDLNRTGCDAHRQEQGQGCFKKSFADVLMLVAYARADGRQACWILIILPWAILWHPSRDKPREFRMPVAGDIVLSHGSARGDCDVCPGRSKTATTLSVYTTGKRSRAKKRGVVGGKAHSTGARGAQEAVLIDLDSDAMRVSEGWRGVFPSMFTCQAVPPADSQQDELAVETSVK
jgi:hypothetical protein